MDGAVLGVHWKRARSLTGAGVSRRVGNPRARLALASLVGSLCLLGGLVPAARADSPVPPVAVGEIGPVHGPSAGGMVVALYGHGFDEVTEVRFGDVPSPSFHVLSGSGGIRLDAIAPAHKRGPVAVTVVAPAGTSSPSPTTMFTYLPTSGRWAPVSADRRFSHTATRLTNGKVLIAGGCVTIDPVSGGCVEATATAEVYDPASRSFSSTGSMTRPRIGHLATLLADGKVLVSGGCPILACTPSCPKGCTPPNVSESQRAAEIYDPVSGRWAPTGDMAFPQDGLTATLLPTGPASICGPNCGKVLVVGTPSRPADGSETTNDAQIYDPTSGSWTPTASTEFIRAHPSALLLRNGKVLLLGVVSDVGHTVPDELYDSATGTWSPTGNPEPVPGLGGPATLLPDGTVLVAGPAFLSAGLPGGSMLYDPTALPDPAQPLVKGGSWSKRAPMLGGGNVSATSLKDGRVLLTGGATGAVLRFAGATVGNLSAVSELYDQATGTWTFADTTAGGRRPFALGTEGGPGGYTATLLKDGSVLVVGGSVKVDTSPAIRGEGLIGPTPTSNWGPSAELYTPSDLRGSHLGRVTLGGLAGATLLFLGALTAVARRRRRVRRKLSLS